MIVLDTCAIIWDALSSKKLSQKAKSEIKNHADEGLVFCDISAWEIAMLMKKGKLQIDTTPAHFIQTILDSRNYVYTPISPEIAELSVGLGKEINQDPADRIIAATAIIGNLELITADKNLIKSDLVKTIW